MVSEEEYKKRKNILKAKLVLRWDRMRLEDSCDSRMDPMTYLMLLDIMFGEIIKKEASDDDAFPGSTVKETYEELFVMSRLYLELHDEMPVEQQEFLDSL